MFFSKLSSSPVDESGIRTRIQQKYAVKSLYSEVYNEFVACMKRSVSGGINVELGSGGGFFKEYAANIITSDVVGFEHVDHMIDATDLPFDDDSVSTIMMHNVFHHIQNVEQFFSEAIRCLKVGGRILIADEYWGSLARFFLKHVHFEDYDENARSWELKRHDGGQYEANGALCYIVFERDKEIFFNKFSQLHVERIVPHTPLRYWLSGGLNAWSLIPKRFFTFMTWFDQSLLRLFPRCGSFVYVEIVRR